MIIYFPWVSSKLAGLPSDCNVQSSAHCGSCYTDADRGIGLNVANGFCLRARDELREVGLSPGVRQTVKALLTVRWNCIVPRKPFLARWGPAGEAEAGSAGVQPAKE